ncbi:MAG: iron-siderophore ABC transporter substrate-binding protein [Alphaproteobacteria bacterium]|nr:iron-siderophore ABC transporter substrate-binding protein [Alphaproteobacteria bacterium]
MKFRQFIIGLIAASISITSAFAADFPTTISHNFGETMLESEPKRVVSLGLNDHDFLYALGIAPVGVKEWWGENEYASWPWAEDERIALGAKPAVHAAGEINLEWVAAQNPDLIVAVYSDVDEKLYNLLSEIAPVIAAPKDYPMWGTPWQEQLRQIAHATKGGVEKAEEIIANLDVQTASIREQYPQFAGKTASMADFREGQFTLWAKSHAPTRFVESFGFKFPENLDKLAGEDGWIYISPENIEQIDLDVVIWPNGKQDEIEALSLYQNSNLFKQKRSIFLQGSTATLSAALWFQTPLSLEFAINGVAPMVAAAVDGDPTTNVSE